MNIRRIRQECARLARDAYGARVQAILSRGYVLGNVRMSEQESINEGQVLWLQW